MHRKKKILVPPPDQGKRLDKYLSGKLPDCSRTYLQHLIKDQTVLVNNRAAAAHYKIKPGDSIEYAIPEPQPLSLPAEPIPLDVLYEDRHLLVINKQPGLVVHPLPGTVTGTLVNALLHHCKDLSGINGVLRPGIVHRLDKNTSGCLIIAKHDAAHSNLADQFKSRTISKQYQAVCWGLFKQKKGEVETVIGRDIRQRNRMSTNTRKGRDSISRFQVAEEFDLASLVNVDLVTGRTHQVRVHLSHLGHPVVGDSEYGGGPKIVGQLKKEHQDQARQCLKIMPRQALHARYIRFTHPVTNRNIALEAELPEDLASLLGFLRT